MAERYCERCGARGAAWIGECAACIAAVTRERGERRARARRAARAQLRRLDRPARPARATSSRAAVAPHDPLLAQQIHDAHGVYRAQEPSRAAPYAIEADGTLWLARPQEAR